MLAWQLLDFEKAPINEAVFMLRKLVVCRLVFD